VSLAFLYNFWVIIYRFTFNEITPATHFYWFTFDYIADFLYFCDIVFNLRTGFLEEGVLQTDPLRLRHYYMNTTRFYVDCLCLLPLDVLYLSFGFNSVFRCFRLVKIYRFWAFLDRTERHTNYPNLFRTLVMLHYLFAIFHWNACISYFLSRYDLIGHDLMIRGGQQMAYNPLGTGGGHHTHHQSSSYFASGQSAPQNFFFQPSGGEYYNNMGIQSRFSGNNVNYLLKSPVVSSSSGNNNDDLIFMPASNSDGARFATTTAGFIRASTRGSAQTAGGGGKREDRSGSGGGGGDLLRDYLRAFYLTTKIMTLVSEIPNPRSSGDYVYAIVQLVLALMLFATIMGHVGYIVTNLGNARKEFQCKLSHF
jgi:hypothetical protein